MNVRASRGGSIVVLNDLDMYCFISVFNLFCDGCIWFNKPKTFYYNERFGTKIMHHNERIYGYYFIYIHFIEQLRRKLKN